jgi:exodeoxyribonuclease V alpha subunit
VFNGTVGVVTALSAEEHTLTVRTEEDELVEYGFDELDELDCAYAVTIHRSWMMLQRNLLYTGITRARQLVVPAGSRRALAAAIRTKGRRTPPHRPRPPPAPPARLLTRKAIRDRAVARPIDALT